MKRIRTTDYIAPESSLRDVLRHVIDASRRRLGKEPVRIRFSFTYEDGETRYHELIFN